MKQFIIGFVLICAAFSAFAIEFTVAPLYFIDETTERVDPRNNFHERLLQELGRNVTGMDLRFKTSSFSRYNPPQSVGDAIVLCRAEQADYLIYGFVIRKDHTIQGELRLLDYERREVIASFFSMDNKDREDEFIRELAGKLLRFIQETYNIIIIPDPPSFTHIQIPVSIGYWLPVNPGWMDLLFGIVRIDGGIQIIPNDNVFVTSGYIHYLSMGIDISYRLGVGNYYDAWDHGVTVSTPILLHRIFNEQHEVYAGLGLLYSLDLISIKKPYEDPVTEIYSAAGFLISGGWMFRLKEQLFFFADARLEVRFYERVMLSFAPRAGIIFRRYTREVVKKW